MVLCYYTWPTCSATTGCPILCPADGVEPVDGVLPDLGFVEGCCDARPASICCRTWGPAGTRRFRWPRCWTGAAAGTTLCWASPRGATSLRRALEHMDAAWQGEEHMAKLSVNAMIGLRARSTEVVYSVRSSSSELDGTGADFSQAFAYEGGMVWDFVYARRLLSNGTYRPIHDAVLGFENAVLVAKVRRILDAPPRCVAQVKTDCLLTQRLPKRFAERLRALEALRHPDGAPVYRVEETKPLLGSSRAPRMEAERPKQRRWNGVDDPVGHCLAGNSLLLTGLPGTGKTHLARAGRGGAPGVQDALLDCAAGLDSWAHQRAVGAQPADRRAQARAHGEHALRPRHLQLREVAAGRRGGVPHAGAGQGGLLLGRRLLNGLRCATLLTSCARCATSLGRPMICGGGCAWPGRGTARSGARAQLRLQAPPPLRPGGPLPPARRLQCCADGP